MITVGGLAVIALIWVIVLAWTRGIGISGLLVGIVAASVMGFGAGIAAPARQVVTSVAPAINSFGAEK